MLAFLSPGAPELLVILLIALLLFGSRLPSIMRSMGKSVTEFKKGLHEVEEEIESAGDDEKDDAEEHPSPPAG